MLKKKTSTNINTSTVDTLIGSNASFEGTLNTSGLLRVDGKYNGDIIVQGNVIIGTEGTVNGNITSDNVEISGSVNGNIVSSGQLKICSTGKVIGDIKVKNLIVEDSAVFEGNCSMSTGNTVKADK